MTLPACVVWFAMARPTRREVIIGIGGITTSAIAVSSLSEPTEASTLNVEGLSIPDVEEDISQPVNGLSANVTGSFDIDSGATPTKIVLRFDAKRSTSDSWTQIGATDYRNNLTKTFSGDFEITGNLLDCANVSAPALTPQTVGETKSITIDAKIALEVVGDSGVLETHIVEDSATIQTTREQAEVTATVTAQGDITVET